MRPGDRPHGPPALDQDWVGLLACLGLMGVMFPVVPRAVHRGALWVAPVRLDTIAIPPDRDWWMDPTDTDSTTHVLAALAALGVPPLLLARAARVGPSTSQPSMAVITAARFRPSDLDLNWVIGDRRMSEVWATRQEPLCETQTHS